MIRRGQTDRGDDDVGNAILVMQSLDGLRKAVHIDDFDPGEKPVHVS